MVRPVPIPRLLPVLAALGFASALGAQTAPPPVFSAPPAPVSPADGATTGSTAPKRDRAISSGVAAALAATMPKYAPPPKPVEKPPEEDLPDLRETDKPRNGIVRLPKFVVREPRPPVFTERQINTKQGLANVAMRRYLTDADRALNSFTLPFFSPLSTAPGTSNEKRALAMYAEDERLKNMSDVADQTNMVMKSDPAAGTKMKSDAQQFFMRRADFGRDSGEGK